MDELEDLVRKLNFDNEVKLKVIQEKQLQIEEMECQLKDRTMYEEKESVKYQVI